MKTNVSTLHQAKYPRLGPLPEADDDPEREPLPGQGSDGGQQYSARHRGWSGASSCHLLCLQQEHVSKTQSSPLS